MSNVTFLEETKNAIFISTEIFYSIANADLFLSNEQTFALEDIDSVSVL